MCWQRWYCNGPCCFRWKYAGIRRQGCHCLRDFAVASGRVIQGNLAERDVRIRFHEATATDSLSRLLPSRPGQGVFDPRSATALHVLQCAWHVQSSGVIMECVADVLTHPQAIAARAGFQYHHLTLDLADQWASKRLRWSAVMVPSDMPALDLRPWSSVRPTVLVQDIIPERPMFDSTDEEALLWAENCGLWKPGIWVKVSFAGRRVQMSNGPSQLGQSSACMPLPMPLKWIY